MGTNRSNGANNVTIFRISYHDLEPANFTVVFDSDDKVTDGNFLHSLVFEQSYAIPLSYFLSNANTFVAFPRQMRVELWSARQ